MVMPLVQHMGGGVSPVAAIGESGGDRGELGAQDVMVPAPEDTAHPCPNILPHTRGAQRSEACVHNRLGGSTAAMCAATCGTRAVQNQGMGSAQRQQR